MGGVRLMEHGFYHTDHGYWQTTGDAPDYILAAYPEGTVEVPLKPSANHEWSGTEWVEVLPDPAEALAAWRETADMDKGEFCIGLMRLKALPKAEAVAAAKGGWPDTFATAIAELPIDPDEAQIIWAATSRVRRMHPIMLALVPMSPLTDEQVDAMFGWVG